MPFDVLIAAGGRGVRMGNCGPKSLIQIDGKPLLRYTLECLKEAGFKNLLVCIDDARLEPCYRTASSAIAGASLILGPPQPSTFPVARQHAQACHDNFVFAYGHAPRPPELFARMRCAPSSLCGCLVEDSSLREPVRIGSAQFLEPPFCLPKRLIEESTAVSWMEFFEQHRGLIRSFPADGPPEFNHPEEFERYAAYLRGHTKSRQY